MSAIDVGHGVSGSYPSTGGSGNISLCGYKQANDNPANGTGVLDTFKTIFKTNATGVKIGTFSGSGTDWDDRDYENIGNVESGSVQTFTGNNCDVVTGDVIGVYNATGGIAYYGLGSSGYSYYYIVGSDTFGTGSNSYTYYTSLQFALYATGETVAGNPYYYYLQQ